MSDLISRSALIKELKDLADANYEKIQCYMAIIGAIGRVQDAPTAYDVEKVVAELEKQENIAILNAPNTSDIYNSGYQKWMMKSYGFKEAIDIVRKGGVE